MAGFGGDSTWVKGTLHDNKTVYVNIYEVAGVSQENEDDYIFYLAGGDRIRLKNCVQLADLTDIEPPEE